MTKVLSVKEYYGFESLDMNDIGDDITDALNKADIPSEFQGTVKITVEYIEETNEG